MDSFCEQILRKKKGPLDWAIIVGTILLALAAMVASVYLSAYISGLFVIILAGIAYGAWWLITSLNVEYEYCVTNGDIDVDQIVAQRKRKRLVSVPGRKVEFLLPYDPAAGGKYDRRVLVAASEKEEGLWCFAYHSKKNGHTFVVFQPDERVLRSLYEGLPKLVQMETDRAIRDLDLNLKSDTEE